VVRAPGLVAGLWLFQLLVAWQLGVVVRATADAATGRSSWVEDGHLLHALSELLALHPAVGAAVAYAMLTSALAGVAFWALAYGGVIARLDASRPVAELAAVSLRSCPAVAVQTLYTATARALVVGLLVAAGWASPPAPALLVLLGVCFTVAAADRARVRAVLDGKRRFHPHTALLGLADVVRRPRLWLGAGLLLLGQHAISAVAGYTVVAGLAGPASIWLARLLAAAGLFLGLWRIALSVDVRERG
jgi:hypothetical protein